MIIFGTRVRRKAVGNPKIDCPTCLTHASCTHEEAKRWFTLFFIPVLPMDTVGEVVICHNCGTQYRPEVLQYRFEKQKNDKPKNDFEGF